MKFFYKCKNWYFTDTIYYFISFIRLLIGKIAINQESLYIYLQLLYVSHNKCKKSIQYFRTGVILINKLFKI